MYLGIGLFLSYISTISLVVLAVLVYCYYFTYDDTKKLPLVFRVCVYSLFCVDQEHAHEFVRLNPLQNDDTDYIVKTLCIVILAFCVVNYVIMHYAWPLTLLGYWYLINLYCTEIKSSLTDFRGAPDYEI